ncbi:MAG TPA: SgcJ/EcaC family oxidoreductase [Candidatus Acidoferrum sp.]|nr:SgcJ/EcaC family oxidoreductase [Candidatus Acidoferrum sp.]
MFERFTEKARRVIFFARYEASQYGSMSIETEHLLLGLFREDHALARKFLSEKGGAQSLRDEIESQITRGERLSTAVEIPISAECKRILNKAAEEAERLGTKHIAPEHILLGILHEQDCLAARLLQQRGLTLDEVREELVRPLDDQQRKFEKAAAELVSVMQIAQAWGNGQAAKFAAMFSADGQFVDSQGNLWIGPERIHEAARLIFAATGWAKTIGKIEDVQFVGSKAAMATLVWESPGKLEKPNPGCVRMTIILTQKPEGWSIVRVQATGLQHQSRTAAV